MFSQIKAFILRHWHLVLVAGVVGVVVISGAVYLVIKNINQVPKPPTSVTTKPGDTTADGDSPTEQKQSEQAAAKAAAEEKAKQEEAKKKAAANGGATSSAGSTGSMNPGSGSSGGSSGGGGNGGSAGPKKNCLALPSACGYPDHTNTGWQHTGVTLTPATLTGPGELVISQDGTVIDGKAVDGCIRVVADNVTIKRSRVRCDSYFPIVQEDAYVGMLVEDVEVDGLGVPDTNAAIGFNNYTMRRVDVHNISEGPHPSNNVLIEDSYIHDMTSCDICHSDTIQSDGAQNVIVRHNTIINQAFNKNAVVRFATEGDVSFNILIENNLLEGGNYIFQIREQGNGFPANVVVRNNRLGRDWRFGPFDIVGGTITDSNNYMDDTLEVIVADQ